MEEPSTDISTFRFSTDELPERDRVPMIREVFGRLHARIDLAPATDQPSHFRFVAKVLPGLAISSYAATPLIVQRTRELLMDGNDDVLVTASSVAGNTSSHLGRELVTNAGDAVPFSTADTSVTSTVATSHCRVISLQRRVLATLVPDLEDRFMRPIPSANEALKLLTGYLRLFADRQNSVSPELRHVAVGHVYDLAALAIGASRDATETAKNGGLRAARLHAIKTDVLASLSRHDLTLAEIALRHGVSPRYVQMLFEREGMTFSQFLLDRRLTRAHRMLSDPQFAGRTISAIAYASGFGDLSHFNRAFRRRYGESPSDVRTSGRGRDG
jgi:AraC-like DNA-binding protein